MQQVHSNYIKASTLYLLYAPLTLLGFVDSKLSLFTPKGVCVALLMILIAVGIGLLLRRGLTWLKYVLLLLFMTSLLKVNAWFDFHEWGNLLAHQQFNFWRRVLGIAFNAYVLYLLFSTDSLWENKKGTPRSL